MVGGVAVAAIVIASVAVSSGLAVQPGDASVLDDLVAVLPFIVAFVVLDLVAAAGLAAGRAWSVVAASVLALGTVAMGSLGLLLLLVGNNPSTVTAAARASQADGLGIVAAFIGLYLFALIALRVEGLPTGRALLAAA